MLMVTSFLRSVQRHCQYIAQRWLATVLVLPEVVGNRAMSTVDRPNPVVGTTIANLESGNAPGTAFA